MLEQREAPEAEDPEQDEEAELCERLMQTEDPAEQIEIIAFMRARGFMPAGRGAAGRFQRAPGGRGQGAPEKPRMAPYGREVSPRGRADMSCTNCGRKGHAASECRQAKVEKGDRPCFTCGKTGHEARMCPEKPKARAPLKSIVDSPRQVAVMCPTDADGFKTVPPRRSGQRLGDFIASTPAPRCNSNRFHSLFSWRIGKTLQRWPPRSPRCDPRRLLPRQLWLLRFIF